MDDILGEAGIHGFACRRTLATTAAPVFMLELCNIRGSVVNHDFIAISGNTQDVHGLGRRIIKDHEIPSGVWSWETEGAGV